MADSKIWFELPKSELHEYSTETIWAIKVNDREFVLENSPFYVYGVSYLDVVRARMGSQGQLQFEKVVRHSGHSTYRILLMNGTSEDLFKEYWYLLEEIGCSYEQVTTKYYTVDVPKTTDIEEAYELLEKGEQANVWSFEEAHFGHSHYV